MRQISLIQFERSDVARRLPMVQDQPILRRILVPCASEERVARAGQIGDTANPLRLTSL